MSTNWLLFCICVFVYWPKLSDGQSKEELENDPNNFHMFENFELTKAVYKNETKIVEKLKEMKENLFLRKALIEKLLKENKYEAIFQSSEALQQLKSTLVFTKSCFTLVNDITYDFPNMLDYGGK